MVFKNDLLNTVLWILFLVVLIAYSLFLKDNILEKNNNSTFKPEVYTSEMREDIERGHLDLEVGASSFNIYGQDDDFVRFEHDGAFRYKFKNKDSVENLYVTNINNTFMKGKARSFELALNTDIPWSFKMNVGAVSGNLNLKYIMLRSMSLDMGAGNLDMTLGKKNNFTSIDIDAGASKIAIYMPRDVGVKIELDGALNSTNLDSLELIKTDSGEYISKNYDNAINKYEMDIDMGVGSFEINYYDE